MRFAVTGASGFVGKRLCQVSSLNGHSVAAVTRRNISDPAFNGDIVVINDIIHSTEWFYNAKEIDAVIHLAARVHVMKEGLKDPLSEYRRVNVEGTEQLALMAARAGVKRFVYVSTIKVNGEITNERPFREDDVPAPQDYYSTSKWEAEKVLLDISEKTGMEVVIIRPPLVYGPGVKGNMLSLMRYIDKGYPLPFGAIDNKRSLISLDNLIDVLILCATKPQCAGNTFVVSDGIDLSTTELVMEISRAMGRHAKLINFPYGICSAVAHFIPAIQPIMQRITGSLVIDNSKFSRMLGWNPLQNVSEGISLMVSDYLRPKSCNIK